MMLLRTEKKIKKFVSEAENKYEHRSRAIEAISRLLEISDEREKAIIFLLVSTGMRVARGSSITSQRP